MAQTGEAYKSKLPIHLLPHIIKLQQWSGLLEAEELLGHQLGGGWLHEDIPGGGALRPRGGHHAAHLSIGNHCYIF